MIKLRLRASEVRLGDRLVGVEGQPHRIVVQVRRLAREVRLSHGGADETRLVGDPFVWIMRSGASGGGGGDTAHDLGCTYAAANPVMGGRPLSGSVLAS